jgi:tetratricopeptide (TPR) repeat protein
MRYLFLALLLVLWPAVAEARWREASSRHFVIYSEGSESELRTFAEQLERFDGALRVQLGRSDPDRSPASRLTIYVFPRLERLQWFLGNSNVAGIYYPRASGSMSFTHAGRGQGRNAREGTLDPRIVLFHEYTHHFMFSNFSFGAPLWFSEGYPEFWSTTDFNPDGSVNFGKPGTHRSNELTELARIPVQTLVNLRHPVRDQQTYAAIYGRGWILAHYLSFEPSRAGQLNAYLRALGTGQSPEEAARAFGDLAALDRELQSYLTRTSFSYATIPAARVTPGPIQIRELGPGEEAIMEIRMRSKRGVNEEQARELVAPARRVGERFPNDAAVQVILAEVEYDVGNWTEAEAAADRAIAADPNMVDAHLFRARALWGRLAANNDRTPERWREVRQRIGAANRLDPDDPEPLVAFFESYAAAGQRPTANAIEGLFLAQAAAREDRSLRITAARQLMMQGNAARARSMLSPLAGDSHAGPLSQVIAAVLAALDAGNASAALAALDAGLSAQAQARGSR